MIDRVPIENLVLCPPGWTWDPCPRCSARVELLEVRYPENEEDADLLLTSDPWTSSTRYVMHPCQHYTGGPGGILTARQDLPTQ